GHRERFHVPPAPGGPYPEAAYLAGNSLGLQPRATRDELLADVDAWARLAVAGHMAGPRPWLPYHEPLTGPAARLVGALPKETVVMNSLTVNLHLLMVSFYRPAGDRARIVIEDNAFPSDSYAVRSQARFPGLDPDAAAARPAPRPGAARPPSAAVPGSSAVRSQAGFHGLDPDAAVVRLAPRPGEDLLRTEDVVEFLEREGSTVALVLLGGVNYLTGQLLDIPTITAAGRAAGA